jgi:NAD(P)H-hydrate epimerase
MGEVGVPQAALMERAGSAAAAVAHRLFPRGPVLVLAGKGNNGGDGLVAGRTLAAWGREVAIVATAPGDADPGLLHGWPLELRPSADLPDGGLEELVSGTVAAGGVVLDGILGTGASGAPRGEAGRLIRLLRSAAPGGDGVLALDIPSGVDATTGAAPGEAVQAALTLCFGWPRMGCLLHPGRNLAGRVLAVEIGFPPDPSPGWAEALTPAWAARHRPARPPVTHKNAVGALAIVAGRPGMAGAAILAGRSALRSGAGYVRIVSHGANREVIQGALPEAVFVDVVDAAEVDAALGASRAALVGPAMGTDAGAAGLLERTIRSGLPLVLDADALTLMATHFPGTTAATGAPTTTPTASPSSGADASSPLAGHPAVITPHPGEARRLLGWDTLSPDPWETAEALRARTGATVLLKGAPSLVLGEAHRFVDTLGSSDLAVAGMGDTLAGSVGAFLAQGVEPELAAGLGLVSTGRAAALAGMGSGLQSGDVPEFLPRALREEVGPPALDIPGLLLDLDPAR